MKNLLLVGMATLFLLLFSNSAAGQYWQSNFNTDNEGWEVYLWPQDDFHDPVYNQDGYICYSNGDQINWLFTKLDWFDWRPLYGGTILFDIKVSGEGDYLSPGGTVILDLPGESGTYFYAGIPIKPPKDEWATIEVPIIDEIFTNYGNPDILVSDQLEFIRGMNVRGNLLEGFETTCIDNVRVFPPTIQPVPNIMANGSDGPLSITTFQPLSLSVSLDAGSSEGQMADWWVAADTPFGIFSYIFPFY